MSTSQNNGYVVFNKSLTRGFRLPLLYCRRYIIAGVVDTGDSMTPAMVYRRYQ
jgi:hypothetical protein